MKRDDLVIRVADTGPGISEEDREKIFNKFYRAPAVENIKGTGLGLAIVKELVQAHGGKISVADNPGGGAVFQINLPRRSRNGSPRP